MQDAQLQQHVQRQAAQFCELVVQAMGPLEESPHRNVSDAALTGGLLYVSSVIDIATGPVPKINLVDMLVFLRLCREALERHWIPEVYGEQGQSIAAAFSKSEQGAWEVAALVLDESQRRELESLIDAWRADNPEQVRVEGVRLDDFAHHAGRAAQERSARAKGLLANVRSATQSADQAVLLAERAMFLVNRMPFLVRMQARVACREIASDIAARLLAIPASLASLAGQGMTRVVRRCEAALRAGEPASR